ncbi:hypothetical protein [Puia dinghuensis]|uniref:Uncharacterized protein n=1 Tax=Puia dinghuensis TaxID=1792502 RepID=A0A8J2U631_9BACT|nr:hypothetical protein [Puia dinghuensis]GGA81378.1 hypothetical protein GCM10011511_00400 [Puia dinghuensis]
MKLPSLISIAAVTLLASCSSSHKAETSDPGPTTWQTQPLTIDGRDNDWKRPLPYTISSEKISYSVTNDADNLYILLSTRNPQTQQKIIQGGMTVWVNTKGDKSESEAVGIGYPLDTRNDRDRRIMEEAQPDRNKNNKPVTLEDKKVYALYGFSRDSIPNYTYGDDNPQGINMRLDYNNQGELIYEASLPLTILFPNHNPSSSYAANSVAVGIFIEGLPPDARVPRGNGGGPDIGVGGGVGFGSFGSGGGLGISIGTGSLIGGGGGRKQLFRQTQTWQVVQLARGQASTPALKAF